MTPQILKSIEQLWSKLYPAAQYSIVCGVIFIILIWFDNFFKINLYKNLFLEPSSSTLQYKFFILGQFLIFLPFIMLIIERLYINLKIIFYKLKYPLKNLNKVYYIISFVGRVCLIDTKRREIRWIKSWQTALDLDFVGEWTDTSLNITQSNSLKTSTLTTKDGTNINLNNFKYVNGIHTQGAPGS